MAEYWLADVLVAFRNSINSNFPKRDKESDGWIGDASHAARKSEHNPRWDLPKPLYGVVCATDTDVDDNDPGRDLRKEIIAAATAHPSVWYVISNGIIYSKTYGNAARKYNGPNGHFHHVHVSVYATSAAVFRHDLLLKALTQGGGSSAKPPAEDGPRFNIHPSRIRNCANGFELPTTDPAFDEVTQLLSWFVALTNAGGKPILFSGGVQQWQAAIRQKRYDLAGKYLKACIVNYQKRYGLVPDGIFGPKSAAIAGGKTGRFDIIGK